MVLLGRFALEYGPSVVQLAPRSQRLLAYVALADRPVPRDLAAGTLWPSAGEQRAHASLRAALAQVAARTAGVIGADATVIWLVRGVRVDLHEAEAIAWRLLAKDSTIDPDTATTALPHLSHDLLPGWYEDWVLQEAETWRQLRLHALETAAAALCAAGRYGAAVFAAQRAISADPLRETPHAALIAAHLGEGNQSEAIRTFHHYRQRLHISLGLEPSPRLRELLPR